MIDLGLLAQQLASFFRDRQHLLKNTDKLDETIVEAEAIIESYRYHLLAGKYPSLLHLCCAQTGIDNKDAILGDCYELWLPIQETVKELVEKYLEITDVNFVIMYSFPRSTAFCPEHYFELEDEYYHGSKINGDYVRYSDTVVIEVGDSGASGKGQWFTTSVGYGRIDHTGRPSGSIFTPKGSCYY